MVSDFNILTASQNSQLFAIQQTSRALDVAQTRVATGNRVNSVTDNPQNYFTAFSLRSESNNLSRVLDRIGQSVLTIQNASDASTTLGNLIDVARNDVQTARQTLEDDAQEGTDEEGST